MACVDSSSRTPTDTFYFSVVLVHEGQFKLDRSQYFFDALGTPACGVSPFR
jgi:hypothetical protein